MQGVIAKPFTCSLIGVNPRLFSDPAARSEVSSSLPFSLKATLPCIKLNNKARALQVHAVMSPFMSKNRKDNMLNRNSPERGQPILPKASKDNYPPKTEKKPIWWWRSLAGLPYLLPFIDQLSWTLAHPKNPPPFLENFDSFVFPLVSNLVSVPRFLLATYSVLLYFWIVRRKEWPHFIRFHVMMGILLGTLVQMIGVSGNWLPTWAFPPYFWSAATFLFLVTMLECIRCALFGTYPGFPFVKDAAFLHSDLNLG